MPEFKSYPLLRASGTCIACDYNVRDEMVLLISPPSGRRTRAFVLELRHLDEEPYIGLRRDVGAVSSDGHVKPHE